MVENPDKCMRTRSSLLKLCACLHQAFWRVLNESRLCNHLDLNHLTTYLLPKNEFEHHPYATVYFVQGILGLSRLALFFFFKDELAVQPAEVG